MTQRGPSRLYINDALVATISTLQARTATAVYWMLASYNTASGSFQNGIALGQLVMQSDL